MVELKIGALHVWLRASILSFSCLTSLHCVVLCNRVWQAKISLTNSVFCNKTLHYPDIVGKNLVCLLFILLGKAFSLGNKPQRKTSAGFSWWQGLVVALGRISDQRFSGWITQSWWWRLARGEGLWREDDPFRVVASHANSVPLVCHAKWKCSNSLVKTCHAAAY